MDFKPYSKVVLPASKGTGIRPGEKKPKPQIGVNEPQEHLAETELVVINADLPPGTELSYETRRSGVKVKAQVEGNEREGEAPAEPSETIAPDGRNPVGVSETETATEPEPETDAESATAPPTGDDATVKDPARTDTEKTAEFSSETESLSVFDAVAEAVSESVLDAVSGLEADPVDAPEATTEDHDDQDDDDTREFVAPAPRETLEPAKTPKRPKPVSPCDFIIAYSGRFIGHYRSSRKITHRTAYERIAGRLRENISEFDLEKLELFRPVPLKIDRTKLDRNVQDSFSWFEGSPPRAD